MWGSGVRAQSCKSLAGGGRFVLSESAAGPPSTSSLLPEPLLPEHIKKEQGQNCQRLMAFPFLNNDFQLPFSALALTIL